MFFPQGPLLIFSEQELLSKAAPGEQVDDAVEDFLLDLADDFVDTVTSFACKMASHRRSESVQVKDIKACLLYTSPSPRDPE